MTFNVVCHVRITPIRGLNLQVDGKDAKNPFVVAVVEPWKVKRKSKPFAHGGANPIWPSEKRTKVDVPYFGHPLPGEKPSLTVMLLDSVSLEEEAEEDGRQYKRIGQADIDLGTFLNQKIDGKYNLELGLKDKQGNPTGGILIASLQFVLTGKLRLTVISGQRLRSVEYKPDQEPFVEAHLQTSRAHRAKRTNSRFGENPKWGEYVRHATLLSFASRRLFSSVDVNQAAQGPNVLEFKYYDDDNHKHVPLIVCQVKDEMNTRYKKEQKEKLERERLTKIEDEIRALKAEEATRTKVPLVPRRRRRLQPQGSLFTLFRANDKNEEKIPLSPQEKAMAKKYADLMREKEEAEEGVQDVQVEDRVIGRGAIDVRQVLTYDGKREPTNVTVELTDDNGLAAGTLLCSLEFENFAFDKTRKDVIRLPEFEDLSWNGLTSLTWRSMFKEIHKLYVYGELNLDMYGPSFIVRTSQTTGMSKILLAMISFIVVFAGFASVWFGLGTRTISYLVGVLYPVYQSYKALESGSKEEATQWLTYWIVYGCFNFFENTVARPIVYLYPLSFYAGKMAFLIWLIEPGSLGATFIYYFILQPLLSRHETEIDSAMETFGEAAREAAKDLSGIRGQLQDEFQTITAVKEVNQDDETGDSGETKRVVVALLEDPEDTKFMLINRDRAWETVLQAMAKKFGVIDEVELVVIVDENKTVKVDEYATLREDEHVYLKTKSDVSKVRFIHRSSNQFEDDVEI